MPAPKRPLVAADRETLEGQSTIVRNKVERLTPRQRQALDMILAGMTAGEAAAVLRISERTMEVHRRLVFEALEARNVAELVRMVTVAGY